jgi:hypothetical protein
LQSNSGVLPGSLRFTLDDASVLVKFNIENGRVGLTADVMSLSHRLTEERQEAVARLILSLNEAARFDHGMSVGINVDRGVFVTKSLSVKELDPMDLKGEMSMMMESIPLLRGIIGSLVEEGENTPSEPLPFLPV